jgi:hypothetical protein
MLFQLLRNVKKWVFSIFLDNQIADAEVRIYSNLFKEEIDDEGL